MRILKSGGLTYRASVVGRREGQGTKEDTPLAGIVLGDRAVVREQPFEKLAPEDVKLLAHLPSGQADPGRDYASGAPLGSAPVTALAGGRLYHFSSETSLDAFNTRLAAFDDKPGPRAGSQVVLASPGAGGSGAGGFPWDEAEEQVDQLSSAWTETPKKVLFIRVDFPDQIGQSVSDVELKSILNGPVAASISAMSYGKTTIIADVSAMTVRLPQTSYYYRGGEKNDEMHQDARNAYQALAGVGSLGGYDIIGVHFKSIGMTSGSTTYGGLATLGGSQTWIQGTLNFSTLIHEFGHNYGIHHASFWKTTDGTVLGASGTQDEYGDIFDMMGSGQDPALDHFGPSGKVRLNWLSAAQLVSISTGSNVGTHRIHRFDDPNTTGAKRALRAFIPGGSDAYWIGHRAGTPVNPAFENVATITLQKAADLRTILLDTTPASVWERRDCTLPLGVTYSDPGGALHITPVGKGGSGADAWLDVNVQIGTFPGNQPPVLSLNVPATGPSRGPITLSAGGTDPNGDPLSYRWDFGDGTASVNAGTLNHVWVIGGTYTVKVTASDMRGRSATAQTTITVSDPLANWAFSPLTSAYSTLDYLDGRFIAIGPGGFHFSANGLDWTTQPAPVAGFSSQDVASDGEVYVAACSNGNTSIYRSEDGKSWKPAASVPATFSIQSITSGQGKFVAVGNQGQTLCSSDQGQTWQLSQIPGNPDLMGVAYGNGIFTAAGVGSSMVEASLYTSPDGVNWTSRVGPLSLPLFANFYGVEFVNGAFYAFGNYTGIRRSTNGINWETTVIEGGGNYSVRSVARGPGFLIAGAESPDGQVFLISLDGHTWTKGTAPSQLFLDPVFADGRFIAAGYQFNFTPTLDPSNRAPIASVTGPSACEARQPVLFRSSSSDADGDALTLIWDFGDGTLLEETASCYHRFTAGGTYQVKFHAIDRRGGVATVTRTVTVADPLATWTQVHAATGIYLEGLAAGGGKLVAGGYPAGPLRVSTDGVNWTPGSVGGNVYFKEIIHDGTQFVACGQDNDGAWKGAIFTSPDGVTWTRRHFSGEALASLAAGPGRYVAVGGNGTILYSSDALSWAPAANGTPGHLHDVAYGDGGFVAGGNFSNGSQVSRVILTSPDGIAWTNASSGAGTAGGMGMPVLAYLHDRFAGSAVNGEIVYSLDRGASFSGTGFKSWDMQDFAYSSGVFFACGNKRNQTNTPVNLVSADGVWWAELPTPAQQYRYNTAFFDGRFYTSGQNGAIWRSGMIAEAAAPGYAGWQAGHFPDTPPRSGPDDDFDGDGLPNLGEYATGSDPRNGADHGAIESMLDEGFFMLSVPKTAGAEDTACHVEYSEDMEDWSGDSVEIVEDVPQRLVVKVPVAAGKGFLRAVFALD